MLQYILTEDHDVDIMTKALTKNKLEYHRTFFYDEGTFFYQSLLKMNYSKQFYLKIIMFFLRKNLNFIQYEKQETKLHYCEKNHLTSPFCLSFFNLLPYPLVAFNCYHGQIISKCIENSLCQSKLLDT